MDKNNCDNNSYFYERNYYKDVPIKDTQILEYWNNILGKDVIELIDKAYGVSIEQILFSEYSLNHKYISFATLNQEYSDMCNEKAISYLTKKGTKVLFDQFVLRFLGYGKRVLERKSRKGYIVKVVQDCFLKNLAERILDVSLSTLIFEMYLAKEQVFIRSIQHEQCFFVSTGTGKEPESHIHITASHDGINGRWPMVRKSLKIVLQKSIESDFRFVFPF